MIARHGTFACILGTLLIARATAAEPPTSEPVAPTSSRTQARVIPWIELNYLEPRFIEPVIAGCRSWATVSDTVCITGNGPYVRETYELLTRRLPGLKIIPGVKTSGGDQSLLKRFDDVAGWRHVAAAVRTACALTGSRRCVLENETAIGAYLDGRVPLDPNALAEGLRQLPPEIEYIWCPGHVGGYDRLQRAATLVRIAQANLAHLTLVALRYQQANWTDGRAHPVRKKQLDLDAATGLPVIPIGFFEGRPNDWSAVQVLEFARLAAADAREVFVYPGGKQWTTFMSDATRTIRSALPSDHDTVRDALEQTHRSTTQSSSPP